MNSFEDPKWARGRAASALASLTSAAEWTGKVVGDNSDQSARLTTLSERLWAATDVAREAEHELSAICAYRRDTTS